MPEFDSPSAHLSARTVEALVAAGLVRAERGAKLTAKIAAGTMKRGDWKLEIDLARGEGPAE